MKKRWYLHLLRKYDREHNKEVVRQLEMSADANITAAGYTIQFWNDVSTYGVDEAILYVKNGNYGNAAAIKADWDRIKQELAK